MVHANCQPMPGPGTYFFTVRLRDPSSDLLTRHIELLRLSMRLCQFRDPFEIEDAVILPDRIHTIWTLPADDADFAARWRLIKSTFAQHIPRGGTQRSTASIWQRRYWEHRITTPSDLAECRDLIRLAPVQARLVDDPADWPFCAANRSAYMGPAGSNVVPLRVIDGAR